MKLISCNANRPLASRIATYLDMRLTDAEVKTFKDREVFVKVNENVRGQDVYVIQSTSAPANDHLMELLITMDALTDDTLTQPDLYFSHRRAVKAGDRDAGRNMSAIMLIA